MNPIVVLVGGHGGMSSQYLSEAEKIGITLKHFENKIPVGMRNNIGNISLILVVVTMVSHSLKKQIKDIASSNIKIIYLKSASISAFKQALQTL